MVQPTLSNEEARKIFTENIKIVNVPSGKQYMRLVPHPAEAFSKKWFNNVTFLSFIPNTDS